MIKTSDIFHEYSFCTPEELSYKEYELLNKIKYYEDNLILLDKLFFGKPLPISVFLIGYVSVGTKKYSITELDFEIINDNEVRLFYKDKLSCAYIKWCKLKNVKKEIRGKLKNTKRRISIIKKVIAFSAGKFQPHRHFWYKICNFSPIFIKFNENLYREKGYNKEIRYLKNNLNTKSGRRRQRIEDIYKLNNQNI